MSRKGHTPVLLSCRFHAISGRRLAPGPRASGKEDEYRRSACWSADNGLEEEVKRKLFDTTDKEWRWV